MDTNEGGDRLLGQLERSDEPRLAVEEEAHLLLVSQGRQLTCRIVEISLGGCRLKMPGPLDVVDGVQVETAFKLRGIDFRFNGAIEWCNGELAGIQFAGTSLRRMNELVSVLCEVAAESAVAAVKRAAERRASRVPFQISGEPIASPPQTPPMAATAAPKKSDSGGRERRNQSRHDVDTTASILLVNIASRLTGRILNLSMGGCRIRTPERFPVGIYTRVETEFHLEGLPFRLAGVVQAIQDRQSVGIRFLDMSARKREQLEQLIAEIDEMSESGAASDAG